MRLFGRYSDGSVTEWIDTDNGFALKRTGDVSPILDHNKALRNEGRRGKNMRRVASIPHIVLEKWRAELGVDINNPDHMDKIIKLLNDPEWAYLRTNEGRI